MTVALLGGAACLSAPARGDDADGDGGPAGRLRPARREARAGGRGAVGGDAQSPGAGGAPTPAVDAPDAGPEPPRWNRNRHPKRASTAAGDVGNRSKTTSADTSLYS